MTITIDVLIPTLCSFDRRISINRALESVHSQTGVQITPVIVINGKRFDPEFRKELENRGNVDVHYLPEPNLFTARQYARKAVTADFFCWLDDDDIYLPNAMARRLAPLIEDPTLDAVISNGYINDGQPDRLLFDDVTSLEQDPMGNLLQKNWLCAAGGLYRTSRIPEEYFDTSVRSLDMTFLAFRMVLEKHIAFIAESTFRKNVSPGSLSTTDAWMLPAVDVLKRMSCYPLQPRYTRMLRQKLSAAYHGLSEHYRRQNSLGQAWSHHISSLLCDGGLRRYTLYTRRLVALSLRKLLRL